MSDLRSFRRCLGKFATGVTVVTCRDATGRPCGITANSFSSVSLEPPLVLWNIAKVSKSLGAYLDAAEFAINVLAADQQETSAHFARSEPALFDRFEFDDGHNGAPLLPGCIAWFECRTHAIHDCGDHYIIVGEVSRFDSRDAPPLLFFGGAYRNLDG